MVPFLQPSPPDLRAMGTEIAAIQDSRIFTNNGPFNARFETALQDTVFADGGGCVTVCNATIGLVLAIRAVVDRATRVRHGRTPRGTRYALMPSFTFAAAAMAAEWAGLTPLFCDVDEQDWAADAAAEEEAVARYGDRIAVIVPYATFGNAIDLDRYRALSERTGIPVVVDAAASLGSLDRDGRAFGSGCAFPIVYSMHATKTFSTGEGGVVHSTDVELCRTLRIMSNFGFGAPRSATMLGLNAKLTEIGAALALRRLASVEEVALHRELLAKHYNALLPTLTFQRRNGRRTAYQFMPVLLPPGASRMRNAVCNEMERRGIGVGHYFSPHLAEQPYFRNRRTAGPLRVTQSLSDRMLSLPLWDEMTEATVMEVANTLTDVLAHFIRPKPLLQVPIGFDTSAPVPVAPACDVGLPPMLAS